ncbi:hypothetical protein IWW37_000816 [Coemansia sp. RSA 2050]|nr:hypothetical protein IWW37_000816 [Coemansia sp. RSA 2050]KAJ2736568.1 hypothetical protein IW152_000743 [Coemansia sp. BCRC 34962]
MNAAAANSGWFMPSSNSMPQGMIGSMAGQIGAGAFAQDRSMAAATSQQQQQQGTQSLLSHLVSLAPPQSPFSAANMIGAVQQQQRQYPGSLFVEQQMNQILQRQHHLLGSQQPAPQGNQHESDNNTGAAAALSLEQSQAMLPPPPPPPKSAPMQLGQPSTSSPSVPPGPQRQPSIVQAGPKTGQQPLLTPQLTLKEVNPPHTSRSTSSTTNGTPPLATAALASNAQQALAGSAEAALKFAHNSVEPEQITPTVDTATIPRPESTASTSPALSTTTKMSKASPKLARRGNSKETKRKSAALTFKKDAVSSSSASVGTVLAVKQKAGQPTGIKKSRTTPAQTLLHSQLLQPPTVPAADTAPATPLVSSVALPLSATVPSQAPASPLASKKLLRVASVSNLSTAAASEPTPSAQLPSQSTSHAQLDSFRLGDPGLLPAPSQTLQSLDHRAPVALSQKEVLGRGIEQLLKFHSVFAPASEVRDLEYWKAAISDNFCKVGNIRLELGTQSYDMLAVAAGSFYYRLFSEGAVVSMHMALGRPNIYPLKQNASIMSFHGVHLTTTYANGRRVLEAGDLRVIFDEDFRIRLWAFSSEDATVCLPRKRPNGTDDALTRTCDATIGRNLDWPNALPTPKRRKSANGKQPPEECALPACALQHLEIANTMYYLQELVALQLQNKTSSEGIMDMWMKAAKPEPLAARQVAKAHAPERKRSRKKSTAAALPLPLPNPLPPSAQPALARADDAAEPSAGDSKPKRPASVASPGVAVALKQSRQQTKH